MHVFAPTFDYAAAESFTVSAPLGLSAPPGANRYVSKSPTKRPQEIAQ